jgi:modulator of FtsH protease HflK
MANSNYDYSFKLPPELQKLHPGKAILIIFILILPFLSFFQVDPEEVGVITRFGKYVRKLSPG